MLLSLGPFDTALGGLAAAPFASSTVFRGGVSGTSRLCATVEVVEALACRVCSIGGDAIGNLVSGPPELRSRRCPRPAGLGCGLVALLRGAPAAMMARDRASMLAFRLLSSELIARGRGAVTVPL
jgi:hypothetical protein